MSVGMFQGQWNCCRKKRFILGQVTVAINNRRRAVSLKDKCLLEI